MHFRRDRPAGDSRARSRRSRGGALASALALVLAAPLAAPAAAPAARLAYVTGLAGLHPQVWVADADGTNARRIGGGWSAFLSPDGQQVAIRTPFTRGGTSLVVRPAAGGPARTLVHAGETLDDPVWSPDSTRVAVVVNGTRLDLIDVATGVRRVLARGGQLPGVSFAPAGDRLVYGRSGSSSFRARVNLWVVGADGSGRHPITHDGRSLYPLWGPTAIAFTHERLRPHDAPAFQLWLVAPDGSQLRVLTHMRIPTLVSGLTPTAWSDDGRHLLAEYGGQDTSEAWTVDVASRRVRDLTGRFDGVIGTGLSHDGRTVLVQRGFFDDPAHQSIATIPFGGGHATVLVRHGSGPTWGG